MKVLVTGANGHLGTNLVEELLTAGHTVRGSVRDLADTSKTGHVLALGPVEMVEADIERPATLRAAADGMDAMIHTAAVYQLYAPGQDAAIVRASVAGIEAALRAAKDAGVKRTIVTSSVVTMPLTAAGDPPVTEELWATDLRVPYLRAKTVGERRAWELSGDLDLELATVLPGAFGGPGFQRNTPTIDFVEAIMMGALQLGAPPFNFPWVDVRDVARAHRLVLESDARGRFAAINDHQPTMTEIAHLMHTIDSTIRKPLMTLPALVLPLLPWLEAIASRIDGTPRSLTAELSATLRGRIWNVSNARIRRELGWEPRIGIEQSLSDTMSAIRARRGRVAV